MRWEGGDWESVCCEGGVRKDVCEEAVWCERGDVGEVGALKRVPLDVSGRGGGSG